VTFTFIDLFSGIGGFHAALSALGGECSYSVEIDKRAANVYLSNWGIESLGDITQDAGEKISPKIKKHDVLVAGFPCQPFSKSGAQQGMEETRGTLYWNILKIIDARKPALVILENVRNIAGPRHTHEWNIIIKTLRERGYRVADAPAVFSPHLLPKERGGRPQIRERVFICAVKVRTKNKNLLIADTPVLKLQPVDGWNPKNWNLVKDLPMDSRVKGCELSKAEKLWIDAWNEFVIEIKKATGGKMPGFPIWGDEWKLTKELVVPDGTPKWKENFLRKNADFYTTHRKFIDKWVKDWDFYSEKFPSSRRKLEWQAQDTPTLWKTIMHMRPSGIRAKKPNYVPALVAITQTSIIGPKRRKLSVIEGARLQGLPSGFKFPEQDNATTFKQLGNGVNVGVVWHVVKECVLQNEEILQKTCPQLLAAVKAAPLSPDKYLEDKFS